MTVNFNEATNNVSLYMVMKAFQRETFAKMNCMKIGIIDKVLGGGKVSCTITNKKLMQTNSDGSSVWINYPPIPARVYYMGSGGNNATFPLAEGSPCLLLFNDREFESFFATGQVSPLSSLRMHALSDCVCVPLSQADATDDFVLSSTGKIKLDANKIELNASRVDINGALYINGVPYLSHAHSNGNDGANTGGVV